MSRPVIVVANLYIPLNIFACNLCLRRQIQWSGSSQERSEKRWQIVIIIASDDHSAKMRRGVSRGWGSYLKLNGEDRKVSCIDWYLWSLKYVKRSVWSGYTFVFVCDIFWFMDVAFNVANKLWTVHIIR